MKFVTSFCLVTALLLGLLAGCQKPSEADATTPLYFASPAASVDVIKSLVRVADWSTLARYYDLTGTGLTLADVSREDFYVRKPPYPPAEPAGIGRFRQLFPAAFKFESVEPGAGPDIVVVTVGVRIDQGGGPRQHVLSTYRLRQSKAGYQLLPSSNP
jgi:hypothetical protein